MIDADCLRVANILADPIAAEGLRRIAQIYKIEAGIRGHAPESRLAIRQAQSAPLVEDFRKWLTHQRTPHLCQILFTTHAIGQT